MEAAAAAAVEVSCLAATATAAAAAAASAADSSCLPATAPRLPPPSSSSESAAAAVAADPARMTGRGGQCRPEGGRLCIPVTVLTRGLAGGSAAVRLGPVTNHWNFNGCKLRALSKFQRMQTKKTTPVGFLDESRSEESLLGPVTVERRESLYYKLVFCITSL